MDFHDLWYNSKLGMDQFLIRIFLSLNIHARIKFPRKGEDVIKCQTRDSRDPTIRNVIGLVDALSISRQWCSQDEE